MTDMHSDIISGNPYKISLECNLWPCENWHLVLKAAFAFVSLSETLCVDA